ncbi:ABC transporter ATP-binding protein [Spirochaeta cellobiosiphila]|uniref:ABC transporter ATP-binding protein n=1 Tax=Spirochaeta cellobiosiphila TaxID=504483 RepID=UPI0003F94200|nr:ABC transporter ATP-binding protein [Spirochaeta cellobiosiphila]
MSDYLQVKQIAYSYPQTNVIDDLSFTIKKGDIVTILGPSGCGKSTFFNILTGQLNLQKGSLWINNRQIKNLKGHVGFMPQKDLLLPWRTIRSNLKIPEELRTEPLDIDISALITQFGLEDFIDSYPHQLSGGMRQRAALLRTYLFNQDFLLLDEPFGALDAFTRHEMQSWLYSTIKKLNSTVLMITHDVDEALLLADSIILLDNRPTKIIRQLQINYSTKRSQILTTTNEFNNYKKQILEILGF